MRLKLYEKKIFPLTLLYATHQFKSTFNIIKRLHPNRLSRALRTERDVENMSFSLKRYSRYFN